jgi:hypothetical protein
VSLVAFLALTGCSGGGPVRPGGSGARGGSGGGGRAQAQAPAEADPRCEAIRPRVRSLYLAAQAAAPEKPEPALAADLLEADVAMVVADCAVDPDRVAPCAERAPDAAAIEQTCLIPLDDEGAVDGDRLQQDAFRRPEGSRTRD